jgi:hypothetical protein
MGNKEGIMKKVRLLVFLTVSTLLPLYGQLRNPSISAALGKTRTTYTIAAESLGAALLRFSADWGIPTGIVWILTPETTQAVHRTFQDKSGEEVLRELLEDFPEYSVRQEGQFLSISPRSEESDSVSFLNLKIDRYEARGDSLAAAKAQLLRQLNTKIKALHKSSRASKGGVGSSLGSGLDGERFVDVRASKLRVGEILGMLAASAGETSFIVTYPQKNVLTESGYRKTISYFERTFPAEQQQPAILFLPWAAIRTLVPGTVPVTDSGDQTPVP